MREREGARDPALEATSRAHEARGEGERHLLSCRLSLSSSAASSDLMPSCPRLPPPPVAVPACLSSRGCSPSPLLLFFPHLCFAACVGDDCNDCSRRRRQTRVRGTRGRGSMRFLPSQEIRVKQTNFFKVSSSSHFVPAIACSLLVFCHRRLLLPLLLRSSEGGGWMNDSKGRERESQAKRGRTRDASEGRRRKRQQLSLSPSFCLLLELRIWRRESLCVRECVTHDKASA